MLPLLGAALTLMLGRRPRLQRAVSITVLAAVVVIAATLLYQADRHGPQVAVDRRLAGAAGHRRWSPTGCPR